MLQSLLERGLNFGRGGIFVQACAFRDSYEKFKKAGAEVVGVSGDNPDSHKVCLHSIFRP